MNQMDTVINQMFPEGLDRSEDSVHIVPVPEFDAESLREMVDEENPEYSNSR